MLTQVMETLQLPGSTQAQKLQHHKAGCSHVRRMQVNKMQSSQQAADGTSG